MRALALLTILALPAAAQNAVTAVVPSAAKPSAPVHKTMPVAHKAVVKPKPTVHAVARKPAPAAKLVAAPVTPAPFAENPIVGLRGSSRVLLIFAPDSRLPAARQQLANLDQHTLELTQHDTVFVSEITNRHADDEIYPGENVGSGTYRDQLSAREKFGLKYNDFAVILLDKNGIEARRWSAPVSVTDITSAN